VVNKTTKSARSQPPTNAELKAFGKAVGREVTVSTEFFNSYVHILPISDEQVLPEIIIMIPKECGLDDTMRVAAMAALKDLEHVKPILSRTPKRAGKKKFNLDDDAEPVGDEFTSETQNAAVDNLKKATKKK
jgi:hypothetical protein